MSDLASAIADGAPILEVDTTALAANWRTIRDRAAPARTAAVVKANAYGCGIEVVVPALAAAGCETFFVAHLSEAARARAVAPSATIYVLHGLAPGAAAAFHRLDARPVLGSLEEIAEWSREGAGRPAALHVDTGMNRLGLRVEEAVARASDIRRMVSLSLLMSHFASAEVVDDPLNGSQVAEFETVRAVYSGIQASLPNSSGNFLSGVGAYDLVRPGYALYGGNPTPGRPNPMRPVVRLLAPVVTVRSVPAGETVGYNGQWRAARDSRIAVVAAGYADGFDRRAGSFTDVPGGKAIVGGQLCPIVARVSMDLITIDVTEADDIRRGDAVTLIGGDLDIDRVAAQMDSIGYELLTHLAARVVRRAVGDPAHG